jgi:spore coat protein CotF
MTKCCKFWRFVVEEMNHTIRLTTGEIANLWTQYINDTMAICVLTHSIETTQDPQIKDILQFALQLAESHIGKITAFFNEENFPIPIGFTKADVNLGAPALFTDKFMLAYMLIMGIHGLTGYAGAVSTSVRADQRAYFMQCSIETMELHDKIVELMLEKGIYSKPPRINTPKQVDFVNEQSYLTGWFGKKRPLNAMEISGISYNMQKTVAKAVLEIAFAQTCQSKELRQYFQRGKQICKREFETLSSILTKDDLTSPASWISELTDSTIPPFSDKLMLSHIVILISAGVGYFGAGLSVSQRRDLALQYTILMADIGRYAEDGAQLLIKNGWLEQPPLASDRNELAEK